MKSDEVKLNVKSIIISAAIYFPQAEIVKKVPLIIINTPSTNRFVTPAAE